MSQQLNQATFLGNLSTAPVLSDRAGDNKVCTFFVAVNERNAKDGTERPPNFIPVKTWNGQAVNCAKYLVKGSEVLVSGRIATSRYEKDGVTKYGWEVVANEVTFLRRPKSAGNPDEMTSETFVPSTDEPPATPAASETAPVDESDIPF